MFICMHTHKKRFTVYTLKYLILSVTKTLLSLCTANTRIPLKHAWFQPPSTAALSRSSTEAISQGWQPSCTETTHKLTPTLSPVLLYIVQLPWSQTLVLQDGSAVLLQGQEGVGCASETLDQVLWEPLGHPAEWGLCLITPGHNNVQQHHITSCCLALFGLTVVYVSISLTDVWLWYPFPATQGKKILRKWIQWGSPEHVEELHWNIHLFS